jgi:hypothetical protein
MSNEHRQGWRKWLMWIEDDPVQKKASLFPCGCLLFALAFFGAIFFWDLFP